MGGKQLGHRFAEGFAYGDYEQTTAPRRQGSCRLCFAQGGPSGFRRLMRNQVVLSSCYENVMTLSKLPHV